MRNKPLILVTACMGFICLHSAHSRYASGQQDGARIVVRLFDVEGSPIGGDVDVKFVRGGIDQPSERTQGPVFSINNNPIDPIDSLRIHPVGGFQPVSLNQLDGGRSGDISLVVWPTDGPKKLDRVFQMLLTYERIYYDYGLDFSDGGRARWQQIRLRYIAAIRGMPHPSDPTLTTDNELKRAWAIEKYEDIVHVFQPDFQVWKPQGHCPCGRRRCCWCGIVK